MFHLDVATARFMKATICSGLPKLGIPAQMTSKY